MIRRQTRAASAAHHVWAFLRSAPLTFIWLAILLGTTIAQRSMSPAELDRTLGQRSTNLAHLSHDPLRVLWSSLFWIDGYFWFPYALAFLIFHVPAERWLGSLRWLLVGLTGHVVATYLSEGILSLAIRSGIRGPEMVNVQDVGVSYFLAAVIAVLTYHIATPWRYLYLVGVLGFYVVPVVTGFTFTTFGHLCAALVGFAWYPMVRHRGAPWNPMAAIRQYKNPTSR